MKQVVNINRVRVQGTFTPQVHAHAGRTHRGLVDVPAAPAMSPCFRLCRKTPSSARERAVFSPGKDGEAGDVGFIVDTAGCSQAEKEPLEARPSFPTEPSTLNQERRKNE